MLQSSHCQTKPYIFLCLFMTTPPIFIESLELPLSGPKTCKSFIISHSSSYSLCFVLLCSFSFSGSFWISMLLFVVGKERKKAKAFLEVLILMDIMKNPRSQFILLGVQEIGFCIGIMLIEHFVLFFHFLSFNWYWSSFLTLLVLHQGHSFARSWW